MPMPKVKWTRTKRFNGKIYKRLALNDYKEKAIKIAKDEYKQDYYIKIIFVDYKDVRGGHWPLWATYGRKRKK